MFLIFKVDIALAGRITHIVEFFFC